MMTFEKKTLREKKSCVQAAYQTVGLRMSSHFGVKKYLIPSKAPGNVRARTRKTKRKINGAIPVT